MKGFTSGPQVWWDLPRPVKSRNKYPFQPVTASTLIFPMISITHFG